MRIPITVLLLSIAMLTAACSSGPKKPDTDVRKAAETNAALGRQYMDRGQYEIALDKLKRAVAFDDTYAPAHTLLGVLYEKIDRPEPAEREFRLAVRHDPEDGDVNNNLGAFLCRNGKPDEAEPYFRTAVNDPFYTTPEIALANAGSCSLQTGDLDKAEKYLRQSLGYDDKMSVALLAMADVSFQKGSFLRARAFLQRYEAVAPVSPESLDLGIAIESALGDEESVERYRTTLREDFPDVIRARERAVERER